VDNWRELVRNLPAEENAKEELPVEGGGGEKKEQPIC